MSLVTVKYRLVDIDLEEAEVSTNAQNRMITIESIGSGIDSQDKATGKALTYAYKYALLRLFAIPTGEDPDRHASVDKDGRMKANDKIFADLLKKVQDKAISKDTISNNFLLTEIQEQKLNEL
jgi:hypothetical protein